MGCPNAFDGLYEFCVRFGFCGCVKDGKPMHVTDLIPETGPVSAEEFVGWLIMADGLDPGQLPPQIGRWTHQLKWVFVEHMGTDVVDPRRLRSGLNDE
jgi:hypothetical protein